MKAWCAALMLAAVVGGAEASARPATPKEIEAIRSALDRDLYDSQSARFRDVQVGRDPKPGDLRFACGQVNAKNLMGAYVGYRPFAVVMMATESKSSDPVALPFAVDDPSGFADKQCRKAGIR